MRHPFTLAVLSCTLCLIVTAPLLALHPRSTEAKGLLIGNWADPYVLKDGDDYYMTHSSWNFQPGTLIWHSKDLKSWEPVTRATLNSANEVWSPCIAKYDDTYYLYLPSAGIWVSTSKDIKGPWSEPIKLDISGSDPGHVTDEQGNRYIYTDGISFSKLSNDGLGVTTPLQPVYKGWFFPREWISGGYILQSPRVSKHDDWYYLNCAQGGTAGPSTSHMVVLARSRNITGPWENMPSNPLIRTWDRREKYWSKGHACLVEGPDDHWYCVMHGFPNGQRSLGRCTIIEPLEWTQDGWCKVAEKWPEGWGDGAIKINMPMSDDFDGPELGIQWQFFEKLEPGRFGFRDGALEMDGYGADPGDSRPLCVTPIDAAYTIETEVEVVGNATAGLMLFYQPFAYLAMGLEPDGTVRRMTKQIPGYPEHRDMKSDRRRVAFKIVNKNQDVQCFRKDPGGEWVPLSTGVDVAHLNSNVLGEWSAIRPALFVAGKGKARFLYFKYEPLKAEDDNPDEKN